MKKNQNIKKLGFTLMELLVVISVIGILMAMGVVSYSTAQKKSRDSRRKADLKQIQNALEECYALDTAYPSSITGGSALSCGTPSVQVMSAVPQDPKSGDYSFTMTTSSYTICADLEGDGDWAEGGAACEFKLINLQ